MGRIREGASPPPSGVTRTMRRGLRPSCGRIRRMVALVAWTLLAFCVHGVGGQDPEFELAFPSPPPPGPTAPSYLPG